MDAHDSHGHSTAAWIGVAVMLVAAALGCYAVVFGPGVLLWIGLAGFLAGGALWYMLERGGKDERRVEVADASSTHV